MKKAIVPLGISLFFSALAIVLLIVFFFLFLRGDRAPNEVVIEESFTAAAHGIAVQYLAVPVIVDNEAITVADLIRLWYHDRARYQKTLERVSLEFLQASTMNYRDQDGEEQVRVFWINIYEKLREPYVGLQSLIKFNQPKPTFVSEQRGRAVGVVPVSESHAVMVELWSDAA